MITNDFLDLDGCKIKDESGIVLAVLSEDSSCVRVDKTPACSIGNYLYILSYLREFGINAR